MNNPTMPITQPKYDPRWFVWTIVFLLVTGVSLVTYIMVSDDGTGDFLPLTPPAHTVKK